MISPVRSFLHSLSLSQDRQAIFRLWNCTLAITTKEARGGADVRAVAVTMALTQNFRIFVIFGKDDTVSKSLLYDESFGSTFALVHSVSIM